ncbi:MAG: CoA transferase, partial [Chloroflexota bacterium]
MQSSATSLPPGGPLASAAGPILGLKVLDLSTIVAGGTASSLMADFGAEVVKVERPGTGDPLRQWGPFKSPQPPFDKG